MDIRVGDVLEMKKKHPCGSERFLCLRTGADLRLRCVLCGHEVMAPRARIEKHVRKIIRAEIADET